jgi:hypothetical protein
MKPQLLVFLLPGLLFWAAMDRPATAAPAGAPMEGHRNVTLTGVVKEVDLDRDRVIVSVRDGHRYTLDTTKTRIALRDTDTPGETGDLVPGMRITALGTLNQDDILQADKITVLPLYGAGTSAPSASGHGAGGPVAVHRPMPGPDQSGTPPRNTGPVGPSGQITANPAAGITLRGTVESVDDNSGAIVVKVKDHRRTIYADGDTEFVGVKIEDAEMLPFIPGDRVTVSGALRRDQTVMADSIALNKRVPKPAVQRSTASTLQQLTGRVSHVADKYTSRDIKIRVNGGRELTIHVPRGAIITRNRHDISMHDLMPSDTVRITAVSDDGEYTANRIDVISTDVF